jgi:hypothetical protein
MFLEMDLGSERGDRWPEKIRRYVQLAASGEFERVFQHSRFRTLIVVPSERRLSFLQKVILKQTDKLFWLASLSNINRASLWNPIWHRPSGTQGLSLI